MGLELRIVFSYFETNSYADIFSSKFLGWVMELDGFGLVVFGVIVSEYGEWEFVICTIVYFLLGRLFFVYDSFSGMPLLLGYTVKYCGECQSVFNIGVVSLAR